ncbi:chloramphenicol resistance protein [Flavihumibacter sp. ZG627]|nr:chloramphenicol resistance protein [Flavihumibacter sp. ZG627]
MLWAQSNAPTPPNIIFILADDLGYGDLGVYGQKKIRTPNIDKLARKGMRFTNFYAGSTVCAPSRAALMTGQHTGHVYVRGNGEVPLRENDTTLAQRLKAAGYMNGMVGKWGLGLQGTTGTPERKGWDFFSGHLHHIEGHYQKPDSAWQIVSGESVRVPLPAGKYANEWFKDEALRFIKLQTASKANTSAAAHSSPSSNSSTSSNSSSSANSSAAAHTSAAAHSSTSSYSPTTSNSPISSNTAKPFFLYVSFTLPHAELVTNPKYLRKYIRRGRSIFGEEKAHPAGQHYGPQPFPKAAYAAMVTEMDDYVGEIMKQLRKSGLEENTIVIFASDNGTHVEGGRSKSDAIETFKSSGALRGVKRDLYEGGIRIPFIVNWKKKIKAGSENPHIGAFWDMPATFAELAGVSSPGGDGISFLPALMGNVQPSHAFLYWEFGEGGFKQAVRHGKWKAIRYYSNGQPDRTELFDLSTDIGEQNNLAGSEPAKVKEMEMLMDRARRASEHPLWR